MDAIPVLGVDVVIAGGQYRLELTQGSGKRTLLPPYLPLKRLMDRRATGFSRQRTLAQLLASAATDSLDQRSDRLYRQLIAAASRAWAKTLVADNHWPSTLFGLWLLLARLTEIAPGELANIAGVATLRWKEPSEDVWKGPLGWRLVNGVNPLDAS